MNVISARHLTKRYGRRTGIDAVDLEVPEGAIFGFLGPNGAGKTTMIRLLMGFLRPTGGRAGIFGLDCWRRSHRIKRDVGYLPGDLRLYAWMTGRSAIGISGRLHGRDLTATARDLAERFKLDLSVPVRKMSRGMRQKLGLILALAHQPRLLILDEPTSGLDPLMREAVTSCLRRRAARGHTVFFSSHTLSEVEQLCDRIAIVREGRIVADETLDSLRSRARRIVTLTFDNAAATAGVRPPQCLHVVERGETWWRCELTGTASPLITWAAAQPLADITIGQPDLESLFRRFYAEEGGSP